MVLLNCQSIPFTRNPPSVGIGMRKPIRETEAKGAERMNGDFEKLSGNQRLRGASELFHNWTKPSSTIEPASYGTLLQLCSKERFLEGGLQLHAHMIKRGLESNQFLLTNLLSLYTSCDCLDFARKVFDSNEVRTNLISWNSLMTMLCRLGLEEEALSIFLELQNSGLEPDHFTFSIVIKVIEEKKELSLGRQLHSLSIKLGYGEEEFVGNSLIKMYAACRRIDDSIRTFEGVSGRSPVAWNSMIARLVENGLGGDGFELYSRMVSIGIEPNPLTFSSLLKHFANVESISTGQLLHAQIVIRGFSSNTILETALLDCYIKCGELETGKRVFERMEERNAITWNIMIRGYSQMGSRHEALKLFRVMRREGIAPDKFTIPALLSGAISGEYFSEEFRTIHAYIIKVGLAADLFIGSSLISLYSTKQTFEEARLAFADMHSMDTGAWSSIISASVKSGEGEKALQLFTEMLDLQIEPNQFIYSSLFGACGDLSMLEMGKEVHAHSMKCRDSSDAASKNSLITMYSNCGCIAEAWRVFSSTENQNVISFNAMISALAQHGSPKEAAELFRRMTLVGVRPDEITLLNLLSAFNHAGLVNEGIKLFNSMENSQGIKPRYEHYACMVDLLARAGEIEEAIRYIDDMPFEPDTSLWRVLLGACSKHRNIGIGRAIAESLLQLEPHEAANYVLLANIYTRLGRWVEAENVRQLMTERGIDKEVAVSWIEINRRTYTFRVEDRSHPQSEEIYERLHELIRKIEAAGYVPDFSFARHCIEGGKRLQSLHYHCEKLAFAFGDVFATRGVTLRIMKNLRVCGDCHSSFKHFSLVTGREILLRDNYRFHRFKDGACSCGDNW